MILALVVVVIVPTVPRHTPIRHSHVKRTLQAEHHYRPLLAYTDEAFPQAQASLIVEGPGGVQSLLPGSNRVPGKHPDWLPKNDFAGVVADAGRLEILNLVTRHKDACKITVIFRLPLGSELAKRLSSAASMAVMPVTPRPFRVHPNRLPTPTMAVAQPEAYPVSGCSARQPDVPRARREARSECTACRDVEAVLAGDGPTHDMVSDTAWAPLAGVSDISTIPAAGARLGPFEIVSALGVGGMGKAYVPSTRAWAGLHGLSAQFPGL